VGQLVADIEGVQRSDGLFSIGLFRPVFATDATAVRSATNALRAEIGLPPIKK
jgi:hypothetical protein